MRPIAMGVKSLDISPLRNGVRLDYLPWTVHNAGSQKRPTRRMIIDAHAHALDEAFLDGLTRRPAFGLSVERRADGRFWISRGNRAAHSLDENLTDVGK